MEVEWQRLTATEADILCYCLQNTAEIEKLSIRQLAEKCHVSKSTIVRVCKKIGLSGFSEFKYQIQQQTETLFDNLFYQPIQSIQLFLRKLYSPEYHHHIQKVAKNIAERPIIAFLGMGNSGAMALYGDRYFSNLGLFTIPITDPYKSLSSLKPFESTLIVLSVSGETKQIIQQVQDAIQHYHPYVVSITNHYHSTLGLLSDDVLNYELPTANHSRSGHYLDVTTQVPVILLLELLGLSVNQFID